MKKIFTFILLLIFAQNFAMATQKVSFIYINGSNNNNMKMTEWYLTGVKKLHPILRKKFMKNRTIKKHYGEIDIKEKPVIFFWGYKSKEDLNFLKEQLYISKHISSSGAYYVRQMASKYLHDAIWVQKPYNMKTVLDDLHVYVQQEAEMGYDVVLYGYSAGSFVSYEYMLTRLKYINLLELFKDLKVDKNLIEFAKKNPRKDTCLEAITYEYKGLGSLNSQKHLILNQNKELLKKNYIEMDKLTDKYCAPDNFKGAVNFASPLVLFYSDLANTSSMNNNYTKNMIKYIFENNFFWITVNFKEDVMAFPTSKNITISDVEKNLNITIDNPNGVIYDHSSVWSKRPCAVAHTSYWAKRGTFSNAVVKSFIYGYRFYYDPKYQKRVLKRWDKIAPAEKF